MLSKSFRSSPSGRNHWPVGQKEQLLEVLVFLFLIVPSLVLSFCIIRQGSLGLVFTASAVILRGLALVSLILLFLWRQSLVAPMVMHFLQDFTGIVLAPWLGLK